MLKIEAWEQEDNWAGITSPAERRKRQNRVNQRAHRKRRHLKRCEPSAWVGQPRIMPADTENEGTVILKGQMPLSHTGLLPNSELDETHPLEYLTSPNLEERQRAVDFIRNVLLNSTLSLQAPSQLHILARMNIFNAFIANAAILSIPVDQLRRDICVSPFNLYGPQRPDEEDMISRVPESLRPTALQRQVVHSPWLDLFPVPVVRDNILRLMQRSLMTEEDLCNSIFEIDRSSGAVAPLVVWDEPWNAFSYEVGPKILGRWGFLLQGCSNMIESTNFWRRKRGQTELIPLLN